MDDIKDPKRNKKSDKAKNKYERNGGFSQKHVRLQEALAEKNATKSTKSKKK
jgi:hypothetical protein